MDVVSVVENVIKDHPFIDFDYQAGGHSVHWSLCPCGFSTKRYKSARAAHKAFKAHITDEVNEALIAQRLLVPQEAAPARQGLPTAPARMLTPSFA